MHERRSFVLAGWQLHCGMCITYKFKKTQIAGLITPQGKGTVDDLDVALYGLELFEVPLEGLEVLQECRLSVRTGHGRHELIRQVRQLVRK
jgi:hypothetical protein